MILEGRCVVLEGFEAGSGSPGRIRTADQRINRVLGFTLNRREIAYSASKIPAISGSKNTGNWPAT